jgi:hypothetical protein
MDAGERRSSPALGFFSPWHFKQRAERIGSTSVSKRGEPAVAALPLRTASITTPSQERAHRRRRRTPIRATTVSTSDGHPTGSIFSIKALQMVKKAGWITSKPCAEALEQAVII